MAQVMEHQKVLNLDKPEAPQMNRDLMQVFQEALEKDPAVDLLSLVGQTYERAHRRVQYRKLSEAGSHNLHTIYNLYDGVIANPDINLRDHFPSDYDRRYRWAMPKPNPPPPAPKPRDWLCEKLDCADTASVLYPLSWQSSALIQKHSQTNGDFSEASLVAPLKALILDSERLFELSVRGAVVKCSDEIAIKIIYGSKDLTEYHNLQYLAENVSDLPIPRPHGLIMLGNIRVMFMSYIPGVTLKKVWSDLSRECKLSLQMQLNRILCRLRSLRQDDGLELGGAGGEGVRDCRIMEIFTKKGITTAKTFDELQFSAKHRASPCYVKLLRSFLEEENKTLRGSVFTHGDLKKSNIIVKQDLENPDAYIVTGIIDWEDSGFYPEYYECTTLSNGQSIERDDDWYLYVPDCISPLQYPVRWLVDRLWGNLLWSWRTDIVR